MCETFFLDFTQRGGIYAWANDDIFDQFSGPSMKVGHKWKIHLGRRIQVDEDDHDGAAFIEDLLEDAVLFPMRHEWCSKTHERWETKEEQPGVWVTRLMAHKDDNADADDQEHADGSDSDRDSDCCYRWYTAEDDALERPVSGGAIALNEYSSASDDDEDLDCTIDSSGDEDACHNVNMDTRIDKDEDGDSENSDSDDKDVCDPAFQLSSLYGPDRVWEPTDEAEDDEDGEYQEINAV